VARPTAGAGTPVPTAVPTVKPPISSGTPTPVPLDRHCTTSTGEAGTILNECFGTQSGSCGQFGCSNPNQTQSVKCCYTGQCVSAAEAHICTKGTWTPVTACTDNPSCSAKCTQCPNDLTAKGKGDADCGGSTALNDFSIWRSEFISGNLGTTSQSTWQADFDCDGKVTLNDFSIWRSNFIKGL